MGGLTLWPHQNGRLAFCVDLREPATALPAAEEAEIGSQFFVTLKSGGAAERIFLPTNQRCREQQGVRTFSFAPIERDAAKSARTNRPVIAERLGAGQNSAGYAEPRQRKLRGVKAALRHILLGWRGYRA